VLRRCEKIDEARQLESRILPGVARTPLSALAIVNRLAEDGREPEAAALIDEMDHQKILGNIAVRLAGIYDRCGRSSAAQQVLIRVAENDSGCVPVVIEAISRLKASEDWTRILNLLNLATEIDKSSFQLFNEKRACLVRMNRRKEAIACMQE